MIKKFKNYIGDLETKYLGSRGAFASLVSETAMITSDVLTQNTCIEMRLLVDELLDNETLVGKNIWQDQQKSDQRILGFENYLSPSHFQELQIQECIQNIQDYLGYKVGSWTLMANKVSAKYDGKGSGGGVHRDSAFRHQVKVIWYLSDVSNENGPFAFKAGSHFDAANETFLNLGKTRCENVHLDEVVTGSAGTRLVCDTKCLHGGLPVISDPRYALTLYTYQKPTGVKRLYSKSGLIYA